MDEVVIIFLIRGEVPWQLADEIAGGEAFKFAGARRSGREAMAQLCYLCFRLPLTYNYLSITKINPFKASPSPTATDSLPI